MGFSLTQRTHVGHHRPGGPCPWEELATPSLHSALFVSHLHTTSLAPDPGLSDLFVQFGAA